MNIKTEAKIHVFFDNFIDLMNFSFLFKLIACPLLFIVLTEMFCNNFNFPLPTTYVTTLSIILLLSTLILLLLTLVIYVVLDSLFFKIDFEYNQFLLCCLLLKKHHSSSKLKLELNKLKQAIENNSQLYNDLNKVDYGFILLVLVCSGFTSSKFSKTSYNISFLTKSCAKLIPTASSNLLSKS